MFDSNSLLPVVLFLALPSDLKQQLWTDLKAAAESGWDFSTRRSNDDTRTSQILPTDLDALLCRNEKTPASFLRMPGERRKQPLTLELICLLLAAGVT